MVVTKKQHKFGSAKEESVLPPNTNDKNGIGTMNFISVSPSPPPSVSPLHLPAGQRRVTLAHCKHSPFGGGGGMVWQYVKIKIHSFFL
jgi:hypothetical protein